MAGCYLFNQSARHEFTVSTPHLDPSQQLTPLKCSDACTAMNYTYSTILYKTSCMCKLSQPVNPVLADPAFCQCFYMSDFSSCLNNYSIIYTDSLSVNYDLFKYSKKIFCFLFLF